jgi:hypothetical protein
MTIAWHGQINKDQFLVPDYYSYYLGNMQGKLALTLLLSLLFGACSTLTPGGYISGRADQRFSFHRSQPIYVALPEPQTGKEEGFRKVLVNEMRSVGLAVTDQLTQDSLVLFFRINNESTNIYLIPGNRALTRLPAQWQEIFLELYSIHDVKDPGPIWEGYLKVKIKQFNANPGDTIRPLLELVGKNYEGPTPLTVYTKTEPAPTTDEIERLEEKVKTLEERIEKLQTPSPPSPEEESTTSGDSPE